MHDRVTLYHSSYATLTIGQVLSAHQPCKYYPGVVAELERLRPVGVPSRDYCVFATDSLAGASAFAKAQHPGENEAPHFYEVEMSIAHRAPFKLIHEIAKRMEAGREHDSAVKEYWRPALDWAFWEYFGPSLTVVREVAPPSAGEVELFEARYMHDLDRAQRIHAQLDHP